MKPRRVYPPSQDAVEGDTVEFACFSYTIPKWNFKGGKLPRNSNFSKVPGILASLLQITKLKSSNAGTYTCSGSDRNKYQFVSDGYLKVTSKL